MQQSTGSNGDEMATATVDGEQLLVTFVGDRDGDDRR